MGVQNAAKREKSPKAAAVGKKPLSKPVPVKKISPSAAKSAHKAERDQPYHHGDLHEALLKAAKRVAEREGINGLTLRAVAREATARGARERKRLKLQRQPRNADSALRRQRGAPTAAARRSSGAAVPPRRCMAAVGARALI